MVVNHPFVNGNKRTTLMSVRSFCALNGLEFAYNRQIKQVLKTLTTNETNVERGVVLCISANTLSHSNRNIKRQSSCG
nr:hypothetical protein [Haloquadratum walsbyi]